MYTRLLYQEMKQMNISKKLLSEVLSIEIKYFETDIEKINYSINASIKSGNIAYFNTEWKYINIYELAHKNLKEWAVFNSVFEIIDWSKDTEQIFTKAEELRNEIDKRLRDS